jgi:hypothetical protein
MTVSGQGLVYNFQADTAEEAPEKPKKPTYGADKYVVEKYAADAGASADAKKAPVDEEETTTDGETMDVFLSLINGVINTKKHMKWDNGALQVSQRDSRGFAGSSGGRRRSTAAQPVCSRLACCSYLLVTSIHSYCRARLAHSCCSPPSVLPYPPSLLQYFAGEPKYNGGRDATYGKGKTNPTGQYTFVFKK